MTYWALGCVQNATCGRGEETKKGQKLSCVKLAICPDHPRRRRPLKFCVRGRVREVVIYFKFHENRSRGLRAVEGRKSPSPIDLVHGLYNSLYYRTSRDNRMSGVANIRPYASQTLWFTYFTCEPSSVAISNYTTYVPMDSRTFT